jgi:hypothetical protein
MFKRTFKTGGKYAGSVPIFSHVVRDVEVSVAGVRLLVQTIHTLG